MMVARFRLGDMLFIWDDWKNEFNLSKHGIDFQEAAYAFIDVMGIIRKDVPHSVDEERFVWWGLDTYGRLLRVSFCYRDDGKTIRIISARKASGSAYELYGGSRR